MHKSITYKSRGRIKNIELKKIVKYVSDKAADVAHGLRDSPGSKKAQDWSQNAHRVLTA